MDQRHVLLTGAFGNIGTNTLNSLLQKGHSVTCFDAPTPANKKTATQFNGRCRIHWGDIRKADDLRSALGDSGTVIHLAGIIPPNSDANPDLAYSVNVEGTHNVLRVMDESDDCKRLIFSSSMAVHGSTQDREPPLRTSDPHAPADHYARHKVECEGAILESKLAWTILRLAACPPFGGTGDLKSIATVFEIGNDARIEFCHPADVGLAVSNAVSQDDAIGKTLFIGGGEKCRHRGYEFTSLCLGAIGISPLPKSAFNPAAGFYGDWLDTEESEALLHYQRHTLDDSLNKFRRDLGLKRHLAKLFSPLIRRQILRQSPYYA